MRVKKNERQLNARQKEKEQEEWKQQGDISGIP